MKIKILMKILEWDKFMHFIYMFAFQIALLLLFGAWSLIASIILPVAKEIYDLKVKNTKFDIIDLIAGIIGGGIAFILYYFTR